MDFLNILLQVSTLMGGVVATIQLYRWWDERRAAIPRRGSAERQTAGRKSKSNGEVTDRDLAFAVWFDNRLNYFMEEAGALTGPAFLVIAGIAGSVVGFNIGGQAAAAIIDSPSLLSKGACGVVFAFFSFMPGIFALLLLYKYRWGIVVVAVGASMLWKRLNGA